MAGPHWGWTQRPTVGGARVNDRQSQLILVLSPSSSLLSFSRAQLRLRRRKLTGSGGGWLLLPKTSLTSPPYPEIKLPDPLEEAEHHREIVQKVNELIAMGQYGRLFAVVHFASRQWKVTSEDLILLNNDIPAECGDRIRMEKVNDFTLLESHCWGKDLVRVEATVIEKTESWPKIRMIIRRKSNYKKKTILIQPQTVLRINSIEIAPVLS
uniref:Large ribosomal subunit protein bL21m n=1 Tax=Podarcis muralis TaxID=64176 RepID=A0A670HPW5_PODMU